MNITIVSKDAQLYRLCRELLADCLGIRCQLSVCASNGSPHDADLTIWDFYPELSLPEGISEEPEQRHLFLVHRKHLQSFRERLPLAPGILLKPVTRAALGAFLEQRMAQHEAYPQAANRLGALRADRDEMLQSLMLANLRLQEYDQDRTTFLNRAVHDFRAPLTALSGYCGLLLAEQLGPLNEQQRDVLERALRSAKRLSGIATAMFQLGVSRHCDAVAPALAEGDLRDCAEQALHELAYLTDGKNLSVSVDLAPLPEPLLFDRAQVEQVLVNLLDNACRFTPKYGVIEIRGLPILLGPPDRLHLRTPGRRRPARREFGGPQLLPGRHSRLRPRHPARAPRQDLRGIHLLLRRPRPLRRRPRPGHLQDDSDAAPGPHLGRDPAHGSRFFVRSPFS